MIIGVFGSQGSGKSLFLTKTAYEYYRRGKEVYSNYKLEFPHKILSFKDITDCKLNNAIVILDEAQLWGMNSRDFMCKKNRIISSQFLLQCRKQNVTLLYASQFSRQIDIRTRQNSSYYVFCTKFLITPNKSLIEAVQQRNYNSKIPIVIRCEWIDISSSKTQTKYFMANQVYKLYNTSEVVRMQELEDEPQIKKENKKSK